MWLYEEMLNEEKWLLHEGKWSLYEEMLWLNVESGG